MSDQAEPIFQNAFAPTQPVSSGLQPVSGDLSPVNANSQHIAVESAFSTLITVRLPSQEDIDSLLSKTYTAPSSATNDVLAKHKTADIGALGENINELILTSKQLDPANQPKGLFGKVLHHIRSEKEQILAHTQSVKQRIDEIMVAIAKGEEEQKMQIQRSIAAKKDVLNRYKLADQSLQQLSSWLEQAQQVASQPIDQTDPMAGAKRKEVNALISRLTRSIEDLKNSKTQLMIEYAENQGQEDVARGMVDQARTIRTNVIPSLMTQVSIYLLALDQKRGMQTQSSIHDVYQETLKKSAEMIGENEVMMATSQATSTIDMSTLTACWDSLKKASEQVKQIEMQASQRRQLDDATREALQREMINS